MELDVPESEVGEPRSIQTQLYLKWMLIKYFVPLHTSLEHSSVKIAM
jgi:hypothetical protein